MRHVNGRVLAVLVSIAPAFAARAQERSPLNGPAVNDKPKVTSIVERDFNGAVRRHESTPEEAAFKLLDITGPAADKVRAIFAKRTQTLDAFVSGNLNLLTKFGVAAGTGNKLDLAGLGMEAFNKTQPLREGGSLWEQVRGALPKEYDARFDELMNEYWYAVVSEGKRTKGENGKDRSRFEITTAERLAILGREIEASFNSQLYSGTLFINAITSKITLSDRQKSRIEELTLDMAKRTNFKPTDKDQEKLAISILAILDEKQRAVAARVLQGGE